MRGPPAEDTMELELEQAPMPGKQRRQTGLEERPAKLPRLGGKGQRQGASGTLSTKPRSNQRGSQERGSERERLRQLFRRGGAK